MNKRRPGGMGASSILMIFVVLALTTFGILSFLSARADLRLTERAADHTVAYYKADRAVEDTLAAIDDALVKARREFASLPEAETLSADTLPSRQAVYEEFSVPVGDGRRQIVTQLEILPLENPMRTTVLRRVLRGTEEPASEAPLPVWPGND